MPPLQGLLNSTNKAYLQKLFLTRNVSTLTLLLIFSWFEKYANQLDSQVLTKLIIVWFTLIAAQIVAFLFTKKVLPNLLVHLISDLIFIGYVINFSGGLLSPFVFLLGLVIITAGAQSRVLLTLIITVLAAITYLVSVESLSNQITPEDTLKILLQTSLLFLSGGIMAVIARRHSLLKEKEQKTSSEHMELKNIHSQVLEVMHEGLITLNTDFEILAFNPAAAMLLGLKPQHTDFKVSGFLAIEKDILMMKENQISSVFQVESTYHKHNLLLTFKRMHSDENSIWLLTIVDITEMRKLERKVAEQDKLASIGQMAAMLAHEIRNPMQTISQAVELMGLKHEDKKLEHIVTDEISRLNRLVSDMLDYANPLHPKPQDIKIKDVMTSSVQQVDMNQQYNIQMQVDDAIIVNLDPDHIRLITDNLLRNALRVSPEPNSIVIAFELFDKYWQLRVRDHGTGIDKDMKKSLFLPFQTGHKKGTGLGLATVWQVCQTNAWEIHIDEGITDGACFVVEGKLSSSSSVIGEKHG